MNEKLIVKNFGPIKDAELDLKKVTVFIGPQGSGKSTLAKLVAICKLSERPILSPDTRPILGYTTDFGLHINTKEESLFQYQSNISSLSLKNKNAWKVLSNLGNDINQQVEDIYKRIRIIDSLGDSSSDSLISVYQKYLNLLSENNISEPIYIPTERFLLSTISSSIFGLMSNNINLPKILTEFGNKFSLAITAVSGEDFKDKNSKSVKEIVNVVNNVKYIELFDLYFQHRDGQDFLIDEKNDYEINLRDSASGMQSSIPLILVVRHEYSSGNKHFIVEEPELNLFPTTQKQLVGHLADKCTQNGNELLMTTHSPYVLSSLNNLLFAYQVANKYPEMADEVATIIPREQWINPDNFEAYYVGENENGEKGGIRSIFNKKTGLIGENELDAISEDLGGEFDALMNIYRTKKRETVN